MFKREEYKARLADVGLTKEQTSKLRAVLEEMMAKASRTANAYHSPTHSEQQTIAYFQGKADGINAVDRFVRGDMDAHDEFED